MPLSKSITDGGGYMKCWGWPDLVHGPVPGTGVEVSPAAADRSMALEADYLVL